MVFEMVIYGIGWAVFWLIPQAVLLWALVCLVSLPLRRQERARLFLDLLSTSAQAGQTPETFLVGLARTGDRSLGKSFRKLVSHLESGTRLSEAIALVPGFLPPRIRAMLRSGLETGDLGQVTSACLRGLADARSQVLGGINYLFVVLVAIGPVSCAVFGMLLVFVFPKFQAILHEFEGATPALWLWLIANGLRLLWLLAVPSLLIYLAAAIYIGGPRLSRWLQRRVFPWTDRVAWALPWKRTQLRRDFVWSMACSLDAGLSEPRALALAAEISASTILVHRARRMTQELERGRPLLEVLRILDRSRELEWRLRNAVHGPTGFVTALRGWIEALEARGFRQEQVAAQLVTTALVLWFGLIVGLIVAGVFQVLIAVINAAALW